MSPPFPLFGSEAYNAFLALVGLAQESLPAGNLLLTMLLFVALIVAKVAPKSEDHLALLAP